MRATVARAVRKGELLIEEFLDEVQRLAEEIPRDQVEAAIILLLDAWRRGGTIYVMGNGGSASTASHFAADLAKYTIVEGQRRFRTMCINDNVPLVSAWTNDHGFGNVFIEQLRPWMRTGDVLVGFSVHGGSGNGEAGPWSQNLVRAMRLARERDARILGIAGFDGGAMQEMADVCLLVPIDREPFGTPLVEAFHVVLHHLLCAAIRQRLALLPPGHGGR